MQRFILGTMIFPALIVGGSAIASASPATPLLDRLVTARTSQVEPVYYYYNHHRYDHRSWDKKRRRWRYY